MCAARADPGELLRVHRHSDSVARALERPASGFSACREGCVSACLVAGCGGGVSRGFLLHDLRTYGFTDPPPSLPVPRSGRETRIYESSWCRRESLSDAKLVDRAYRVPRNLQQRFPSDMIELCQLQSRVRAVRSPAPHADTRRTKPLWAPALTAPSCVPPTLTVLCASSACGTDSPRVHHGPGDGLCLRLCR